MLKDYVDVPFRALLPLRRRQLLVVVVDRRPLPRPVTVRKAAANVEPHLCADGVRVWESHAG